MWRAICRFRDLTDGHLYEVGDAFPFDGREIPQARADALISGQNVARKALIAADDKSITEAPEQPKKPRRTRKTT